VVSLPAPTTTMSYVSLMVSTGGLLDNHSDVCLTDNPNSRDALYVDGTDRPLLTVRVDTPYL
jgi:hypothetical protein